MNNVISTKIKFFRNVKDYKFCPKLDEKSKNEIINKLVPVLEKDFKLIDLKDADESIINFLNKNNLTSKANQIFVSKNKNLVVNLFDGEHISVVATSVGCDKNVFKNAKEIVDEISDKISLSFSDEYGYLMSDLTKIGAGLSASCELCLDSLKTLNKIEQVKQNLKKLGYNLQSTNKKSVYELTTVCNLGFSEKEIIDEFEKLLSKLQDLEIESVKMLEVANKDEFIDKVNRSVAILQSAYLLSADELSEHLINLRNGLNLGLINIAENTINSLQNLINSSNLEIVSASELKELANTTKEILKGDANV